MRLLSRILPGFLRNARGTTAIEYAVIASGVAMAIVAIVYAMGSSLNTRYEDVQTGFEDQ
jgi:pilus assembly protein Flp/PilA